jgi:hypothetical protein
VVELKKYIAILLILLVFAGFANGATRQYVSKTLTYSATINITSVVRGDAFFFMTATGNTTFSIYGGVRGDSSIFMITCDGTPRVMTFGTGFTSSGTLTLVASQISVIRFTYTGATWKEEYRGNGTSSGGLPLAAQGDMLYASATNTWANLSKDTTATRYLANTGTTNNPKWDQVALTTGVTGILPVANGGTNKASWTQWGIPYADTTTSFAQIASGSSGQILRSNGGAAQGWTTPTYPNTATTGKVLIGDGTNVVLSTPSYPNASATAGKVIRSDGTNFASSTLTMPDTIGINEIPFASSANILGVMSAGNDGILKTSNAGVPSIATDIPTAVTIGSKYIYRAEGTDVPITDGGTGASTKAPAFDALSPMNTLGDMIYGGASGTGTQLAGNITTTKKFLSQTGTGAVSAAMVWDDIVQANVGGLTTASSPTFVGVTVGNTGLKINDTGADHTLNIKNNENLSANRILNYISGDADRTITLSGNPTMGDYFDQAVKQASTPTFASVSSKAFLGTVVPLVYASPISCDTTLGEIFTTTTVHGTGSVSINATTGGTAGKKITFLITNDATTGKTITFGTNFTPNGTLAGTVNLTATVVFVSNGTSWIEQSRSIPTVIKNNQDVSTAGTPALTGLTLTNPLGTTSGGTGMSDAYMFVGLYNRERSDKWAIKSYTTDAQRYILQTPTTLAVYLNGKVYVVSAKTDYDLSLEATWDAVAPTDYRVAATRAGKDFYVYACEQAGNTLKVLISANASAPTGYTTTTSRLIGGFHCLCLAVGAIAGHTLTNFATGDILPNSVWDYNFRPVSSPAGMVYSTGTGLWVDIYLASGTGANTASVFGGTISDTRDWNSFVDDGGAVSKRLLYDPEFQIIATGSNEETNITASADPVTTGGHVDTAARRMIANNGCEDMCGVAWQWLLDQGYRYDGGAHTHNNTITYRASPTGTAVYKLNGETTLNADNVTDADEVITGTSVDPVPAWAYYNLPGAKGSLYRQGTYGDVKLLAGSIWDYGTVSGSQSRYAVASRWSAGAAIGGRFASEPLNR